MCSSNAGVLMAKNHKAEVAQHPILLCPLQRKWGIWLRWRRSVFLPVCPYVGRPTCLRWLSCELFITKPSFHKLIGVGKYRTTIEFVLSRLNVKVTRLTCKTKLSIDQMVSDDYIENYLSHSFYISRDD